MISKTLAYVGKSGLFVLALVACAQDVTPLSQGIFSEQPLWKLKVDETIVSTIAATDEIILIRTSDSILAYDIKSRERLWSNASSGEMSAVYPPVVIGDILLVPDFDGAVAAFRISNGEKLWTACSDVCRALYHKVDSLAVLGNTVFITRQNDVLRAHDLLTGQPLWTDNDRSRATSHLAVTSDRVIRTVGQEIIVYDASTGRVLSNHALSRSVGDTIIDNDSLYMILSSDLGLEFMDVVAYNFDQQSELWSFTFDTNQLLVSHWITISGDTLYITGGKSLWALSAANGSVKWQQNTSRPLRRVTITDNDILLARDSGDMYAFDQETGNQLGKLQLMNRIGLTDSGAEIGLTIVEETIFVPIGDNWVYAYTLSDIGNLDK